jgi:4-hydroxy-tetrahydrodipicolinate synthase
VYAGTGAISTREAIFLTQMAEDCGADAAVLITPFYIAPTGEELYEHFAAIAKATSLPLFPYNNPGRTGVNLGADVIARLSSIDNVVGVKDSSGNMALTRQYIEGTPPAFAVCQGRDDIFFPSFVIGCCAAVAATANVAPDLVSEIYESFTAGDFERSQRAQSHIAALRRALSLGTFPAVIKGAMTMTGMPMGPARAPVAALSSSAAQELHKVLASMGVLSG